LGVIVGLVGLVASADSNGDHRISPKEFQGLFDLLDKNHDGYLDAFDRNALLGVGVAKK